MAATPIKAKSVIQAGNRDGGSRFVKGVSGNPGGRPKRTTSDGRSVAEIARGHTELAIATLVAIATASESDAARVSAANGILDRGWGKPTQPISGDDERPPIEYVIWPVPAHRLENPQ